MRWYLGIYTEAEPCPSFWVTVAGLQEPVTTLLPPAPRAPGVTWTLGTPLCGVGQAWCGLWKKGMLFSHRWVLDLDRISEVISGFEVSFFMKRIPSLISNRQVLKYWNFLKGKWWKLQTTDRISAPFRMSQWVPTQVSDPHSFQRLLRESKGGSCGLLQILSVLWTGIKTPAFFWTHWSRPVVWSLCYFYLFQLRVPNRE